MTSIKSHQRFSNGASRPAWAGAVNIVSRQRTVNIVSRQPKKITASHQIAPGIQTTQSTEFSGLVLPVSAPSVKGSPSFGQGLGFPHLGEHLPDVDPNLQKNWGRFEKVLSQAAAGMMEWKGSRDPQLASRSAAPQNVLHLRAVSQSVTRPTRGNQSSRSESISGEISKMFAIRDVSGSQLRFESAGSTASFRLTPSSIELSRDPRTL
jgi:hypothetical protein